MVVRIEALTAQGHEQGSRFHGARIRGYADGGEVGRDEGVRSEHFLQVVGGKRNSVDRTHIVVILFSREYLRYCGTREKYKSR
jgi:hypothetical protein